MERKDFDLEIITGIDERLDRIEKKLSQTRTSGGGVGCLGLALFVWVIALLYEILEKLGG